MASNWASREDGAGRDQRPKRSVRIQRNESRKEQERRRSRSARKEYQWPDPEIVNRGRTTPTGLPSSRKLSVPEMERRLGEKRAPRYSARPARETLGIASLNVDDDLVDESRIDRPEEVVVVEEVEEEEVEEEEVEVEEEEEEEEEEEANAEEEEEEDEEEEEEEEEEDCTSPTRGTETHNRHVEGRDRGSVGGPGVGHALQNSYREAQNRESLGDRVSSTPPVPKAKIRRIKGQRGGTGNDEWVVSSDKSGAPPACSMYETISLSDSDDWLQSNGTSGGTSPYDADNDDAADDDDDDEAEDRVEEPIDSVDEHAEEVTDDINTAPYQNNDYVLQNYQQGSHNVGIAFHQDSGFAPQNVQQDNHNVNMPLQNNGFALQNVQQDNHSVNMPLHQNDPVLPIDQQDNHNFNMPLKNGGSTLKFPDLLDQSLEDIFSTGE